MFDFLILERFLSRPKQRGEILNLTKRYYAQVIVRLCTVFLKINRQKRCVCIIALLYPKRLFAVGRGKGQCQNRAFVPCSHCRGSKNVSAALGQEFHKFHARL